MIRHKVCLTTGLVGYGPWMVNDTDYVINGSVELIEQQWMEGHSYTKTIFQPPLPPNVQYYSGAQPPSFGQVGLSIMPEEIYSHLVHPDAVQEAPTVAGASVTLENFKAIYLDVSPSQTTYADPKWVRSSEGTTGVQRHALTWETYEDIQKRNAPLPTVPDFDQELDDELSVAREELRKHLDELSGRGRYKVITRDENGLISSKPSRRWNDSYDDCMSEQEIDEREFKDEVEILKLKSKLIR